MTQHPGPGEVDAWAEAPGSNDPTEALPTATGPAMPRSWLESSEQESPAPAASLGAHAVAPPDTAGAAPAYKRGPAVFTMFLGALLLGTAILTIIAQVRREPIAIGASASYVLVGIGLFVAAAGALTARGRRRPPPR